MVTEVPYPDGLIARSTCFCYFSARLAPTQYNITEYGWQYLWCSSFLLLVFVSSRRFGADLDSWPWRHSFFLQVSGCRLPEHCLRIGDIIRIRAIQDYGAKNPPIH